jgi:hypothetical protein
MQQICKGCDGPSLRWHTCSLDDGWYCDTCFDKHPCLENHEPGCACVTVDVGATRDGPPDREIN